MEEANQALFEARESKMIRTVHLHGYLADKYGPLHRFNLNTPAEAIQALQANYPDFCPSIKDGRFHIVTGGQIEARNALSAPEMQMGFGDSDLHIVPAIVGGKFDFMEIILGVALIALAFIPGVGTALAGLTSFSLGGLTFAGLGSGFLFMAGAVLVLGGIVGLITPVTQQIAGSPSFLFNGAINTTKQGGPVPVIYGTFGVGSTLINAGVKNENIAISVSSGDILVPGLTGLTQAKASAALERVGLSLGGVTYQAQPFYAPGLVISQWPDAGSYLNQGDSVSVVISKFGLVAGAVAVPDLTGMTETQAIAALGDIGLSLGAVTYKTSYITASGLVLSQTPAAGTYINQADTVSVVLSKLGEIDL